MSRLSSFNYILVIHLVIRLGENVFLFEPSMGNRRNWSHLLCSA